LANGEGKKVRTRCFPLGESASVPRLPDAPSFEEAAAALRPAATGLRDRLRRRLLLDYDLRSGPPGAGLARRGLVLSVRPSRRSWFTRALRSSRWHSACSITRPGSRSGRCELIVFLRLPALRERAQAIADVVDQLGDCDSLGRRTGSFRSGSSDGPRAGSGTPRRRPRDRVAGRLRATGVSTFAHCMLTSSRAYTDVDSFASVARWRRTRSSSPGAPLPHPFSRLA